MRESLALVAIPDPVLKMGRAVLMLGSDANDAASKRSGAAGACLAMHVPSAI